MLRFRAINNLPFRYLVFLSFLGYVLLAIFFPLLPNYNLQPVGDIRTFAPGIVEGFLYGLLILVLFILYWLIYQQALTTYSLTLKLILGISVLLAAPLLFMYPINANDVYRYVIRGLISSRYGASPFEFPPSYFGDALYPLLTGEWFNATSPYGPLWESLAFVVTSLGQEKLLINILIFKFIGLFSLVSVGAILWKLFSIRSQGHKNNEQTAYTALWVINPALLLSFVGNAHNDALMILFLLLGWLVVNSGYRGPGFLILLAASLVKPIALLAAPIIFLSSLRDIKQSRDRFIYFSWVFAGGAGLFFLAFLPFGDPLPLIMRLLREASAGASFSPTTLLILIAREFNINISLSEWARLTTGLFFLLYFWVLWRTWRGKSAEQGVASAFWGYIFQALNFRIWYAAWPFPWLLLDAFEGGNSAVRHLNAGFWFLLMSQLSVIIYGHFRIAFLGGDIFLAHLIGVFFVFFLPFIFARFLFPIQPKIKSTRIISEVN